MDWLIQSGEVIDRTQGLILGKELLDQAIIKHGKERLLTMQMKKRRRKPGLAAVLELQSDGPNNSS